MSDKYPQRSNNKNYRYNNSGSNGNNGQNRYENSSTSAGGAGATGGGGGGGGLNGSNYSNGSGSGNGNNSNSGNTRYKNDNKYTSSSSSSYEQRFDSRPNSRMNRGGGGGDRSGDRGNRSNFNYHDNVNDRSGLNIDRNNKEQHDNNSNSLTTKKLQPQEDNLTLSSSTTTITTTTSESGLSLPVNETDVSQISVNDSDTPPKEFDKWEDLEGILNESIMRGVYSYGFDTPSLIQRKALLTMFDKKDIIAQAQSGTGKTGVFTIGVLQNINPELNKTQGLIMAPTRELAKQIHEVITSIGSVNKSIKYHLLIGGTSTDDDAFELKNNVPHIIIGCPGRVYDMMRRNNIIAKDITMLVLDEADEMLSVGFKEQVYNIFQFLNNDVQVGLFSATLPVELQALTEKFMRNPVRILVKSELLTLEGIKQYYVALNDDSQKYATLKDIFNIISMSQCIIYCNSIKRVMDLTEAMQNDGFPVCCIHSNMEKSKRDESYSDFKAGKHRVLISSNVTSRGIDVQQVRTVLNFDLPKCVFNYLHRIGRSGRWGRKGTAINFVTRWDMKTMKEIERHYHTIVDELPANIIID